MNKRFCARINNGMHFRNSTEIDSAMGKKVGEMVAAKPPR